jgi:hypothetical protein
MKDVNTYIDFKVKQYMRISGFDTNQDNAKDVLAQEVKPMLRRWVAEFIASTK